MQFSAYYRLAARNAAAATAVFLQRVAATGPGHVHRPLFLRQSFPDFAIVSVDERLRANAAILGFETEPAHR